MEEASGVSKLDMCSSAAATLSSSCRSFLTVLFFCLTPSYNLPLCLTVSLASLISLADLRVISGDKEDELYEKGWVGRSLDSATL